MKLSPKNLIFTAALASLIAFGVTGTNPTRFAGVAFAQSQAAGPKPEMSDTAFKNIQVLKGIPVDEFMGTMGLFSAALSVCCGDCHTGAGTSHPKWEDDAPAKKKVARLMVQMVNNINKTNFGGRQVVTCWTCHRGNETPALTPPIDAIYSTPTPVPPDVLPAAPPATSGTPPAEEILDRYVKALGSTDAEAKITSYMAKGSSLLYDSAKNDPAEFYAKAPDQFAMYVHQREGEMARTFTGRESWVMLPLTVVGEYPLGGGYEEGAKLVGEMAFPWKIKGFFTNWKVSYPQTLNGNEVYVVQATSGPKGVLASFYFDKQTGLLARLDYYAPSAVGRVPTQLDYGDYRPVAGVKMPFKVNFGWVSGREEYNLTDYQVNVPVPDSRFTKPVPSAK